MKNEESKILTRVPQSFSFDHSALIRTFGEEGHILRDLLIFLSNNRLINLFGEFRFSIDDFCKELGHNRTTLQRTVFELKEGIDLPILDDHVFDGLFEFALYRGLKENIIFQRKRQGKTEYESMQIFEKVEVYYNKSTNKDTKRNYSIKLSNKITNFLYSEYNLIDYDEYKKMKSTKIEISGSYRNFYIYLGRIVSFVRFVKKSKSGDPTFVISIDEMCKILNIDSSRNYEKKRTIKRILNTIKSIMTKTDFEWEFCHFNNSRYAYYVKISIPDGTIEYLDEKNDAVIEQKYYEACHTRFLQLKNIPAYEYKKMKQDEFEEWFANSNEDIDYKINLYSTIKNSFNQ